MWMCQRGWSFCHTLSTTPVLRLGSVWSDLFACGLTFSWRTGHEEVGRMWLGTRLSFLAERANKTGRQHLVSQTASYNWDLTGEVIRGGAHAAPLEERLRFGVHHQQTGHVPADFDGRHDLRMRLSFHRHAIHLSRKTRRLLNSTENHQKHCVVHVLFPPHRAQDLFYNIITLSEARGSRAGNPVDPRHTHKHTHIPQPLTSQLTSEALP